MYIHIHIHIYTHTYTYTYIHIHKLKHDLKIYNTRLTDNLKKANRARIIGSLQSAVKMYFVIGEASKQK